MSSLLYDVTMGWRNLLKARWVSVTAIVTLALGIGANSAVFSLVDSLLLRPLPIPDAEEVLVIDRGTEDGRPLPIPIPKYQTWYEHSRGFAQLGAFYSGDLSLTGTTKPMRLQAVMTTSEVLPILVTSTRIGRLLNSDADHPGSQREAVLSYSLWQRRFGGDAKILGQTIELDGMPFAIIGVLPPEFVFPTVDADLFLPIGAFADVLPWTSQSTAVVKALGRLRPGWDLERIQQDLDAVTAGIAEATGVYDQPRPRPQPVRELLVGPVSKPILVLLGAVGGLLLIACANVVTLLLVRAEKRREELAMRVALGASRGQILRQLLIEGAWLAGVGSVLGLALAPVLTRVARRWLPVETPLLEFAGMDFRVLFFTAAVAFLTAALIGLVPGWQAIRQRADEGVRPNARAVGRGARLRSGLIVGQIALALILLTGTGLMTRTLASLAGLPLGFEAGGVLTESLLLPASAYPDRGSWIAFHERLLVQAAALPGVEESSLSSALPLRLPSDAAGALPEGRPITRESIEMVPYSSVSPSFFSVLRIPFEAGRPFSAEDDSSAPPVAIVDAGLADRFWPGQSAIGQRLAFEFRFPEGGYRQGVEPEPFWREVVGVVGAVRQNNLHDPAQFSIYIPFTQPSIYHDDRNPPTMAVAVRTSLPPSTLARPLRQVVASLDPSLPVFDVEPLTAAVARQASRERLIARVLGCFSALALGLAMLGVYGVIAHSVQQRRREIGLRLALGAERGQVRGLVLRQGLGLAVGGAIVGFAGALPLSRLLASLLHGVRFFDPPTLIIVTLLLLAVVTVSSLLPAWRASRIDPAVALRPD